MDGPALHSDVCEVAKSWTVDKGRLIGAKSERSFLKGLTYARLRRERLVDGGVRRLSSKGSRFARAFSGSMLTSLIPSLLSGRGP